MSHRKTILVVEDDPHQALLVGDAVSFAFPEFELDFATNGRECLKKNLDSYCAILLDQYLPDTSGTELLKTISSKTCAPIIVMTAAHSSDLAIQSLRYGASDYVVKGTDAFLDMGLILQKSMFQKTVQLKERNVQTQMQDLLDRTLRENKELGERAILDGLTGLYNHRVFHERLESEINLANRLHHPLSVTFLDLDNFKDINDSYGHPTGDAVLKNIGKILLKEARNYDCACRYGGDEFALILPGTRQTDALHHSQRVLESIRAQSIRSGLHVISVTASIGVSQLMPGASMSKEDLIDSADMALYHAKHSGRNRAACPEESTQETLKGFTAKFQLRRTRAI